MWLPSDLMSILFSSVSSGLKVDHQPLHKIKLAPDTLIVKPFRFFFILFVHVRHRIIFNYALRAVISEDDGVASVFLFQNKEGARQFPAVTDGGKEGLKKAAPQKPCVFLADKRPRRMEKSLDFLLGGIPGRDHADIVRRVPSQIIELSAENGKVCEYAQIADESREPGRILRIDERKYHRARDLHDGKKNDRKRRAE